MKYFSHRFSPVLVASVFFAAASAVAAPSVSSPAVPARAKTETNSVASAAVEHKSVFDEDLKNAKDPFFPKSTRRSNKTATIHVVVSPISQLALKGISGSANRRLALINNQPISVGETAYVRIASGQIKVHCWEIREDSVLVSIEGDPEKKELRLRNNF